jgi:hypothetical protein
MRNAGANYAYAVKILRTGEKCPFIQNAIFDKNRRLTEIYLSVVKIRSVESGVWQ